MHHQTISQNTIQITLTCPHKISHEKIILERVNVMFVVPCGTVFNTH